jgi:pectinesterase
LGYQDTLYPRYGTQYFRNCYVEGTVDFIFGGASAVFDNCKVVKVGSGVAITAPSTPIEVAFGLVFLGGKMTSTGGGSTALGRPWRPDGMSAFIGVELGSHISSTGFVEMSGNQPQNARFGEAGSSGPGANPNARSDYQLSASEAAGYTLTNIFPGWVPSYSK